ncbi:hypothetical protein HZA40_02080 [Candidatus Peregrinibacteria bacterium]|nr:hypothetical protein [Candidatus Peregrinibacteria bacterium]
MTHFKTKNLIILLYLLAGFLLLFLSVTIFFQYYIALGSWDKVLAAFGNDRILSALWLSVLSSIVTTFVRYFLVFR